MTSFRVDAVPFTADALEQWSVRDPKNANWPVVYTLDGAKRVYVGESIHAFTRMRQHLGNPIRDHLANVHVVVDPTFNKSACLDLESFLIGLFAGEGRYVVDNSNAGLNGSDYFDREIYHEQFREIFKRLRADGLFEASINDIENSDLFKLSPFKTLNYEQRVAVATIVERLFQDLRSGQSSTAVIQGQPGTGKTIVAIYLMKLLSDIRRSVPFDDSDTDTLFAGFFTPDNAHLLENFRMGLVVPMQSLRSTVGKVFKNTSGLDKSMVLSPTQVGGRAREFDLLIVDESHRLQQLSATMAIKRFREINQALFDGDETGGNQLDWVRRKSTHQIFMLDPEQTIKPASDLPEHVIRALEREAADSGRLFALKTQMRVMAGEDYIGYVRSVFSPTPPQKIDFADYELKLFDDLREMQKAIFAREDEVGLSRLLAGYAGDWRSKSDPQLFDIELDGLRLRWNVADTDWISSPTSIDEVGSIHTTQGYDLNYAGVIIGPDLRFDSKSRKLYVHRDSYRDEAGKRSNHMLGIKVTDDLLLTYITNIYRVLMTRGIRGTYLYVCDPELREYLSGFVSPAGPSVAASAKTPAPVDVAHDVDGDTPAEAGTFRIELGARTDAHESSADSS